MSSAGLSAVEPLNVQGHQGLPTLLTPRELANVLRTTRKAIYAMIQRGQVPGVVRIGRRVLVREDVLVHWMRQKSTPSLEA